MVMRNWMEAKKQLPLACFSKCLIGTGEKVGVFSELLALHKVLIKIEDTVNK